MSSSQGMRKRVGSHRCRWLSTILTSGMPPGYHPRAMLIDERSALLKSLEERARSLAETYAWTDGAMNVIGEMLLRRQEKEELLAALGALRGHSRAGRD